MKKNVLTCLSLISSVALIGCSLSSPDVSLSSEEASSVADENDKDEEAQDDKAGNVASTTDVASEADTKPEEDIDDLDAEALLHKFLDDEIDAIAVSEGGEETSFLYSELPHDEDDWESYSYDDDSFVDLDNDNDNELILYGPYGGMYLDARDGKVYVLAQGEGTALVLGHAEYEGLTYIVHSDTSHAGRQIHLFDRYEDGVVVDSFDLSAQYWDNEFDYYDQDSEFTFNDEKITMEEYEALCKEILGYKTKVELMHDIAVNEAESFDYSQEKVVNDGSEAFLEKVAECIGEYYYPEDSDGNAGTLTIKESEYDGYDFDDNYEGGDYRFLSSSSDIEFFIGNSICLKYPQTVYDNGDAVFTYYVITCYDYFVHVYVADENYENLEYLYTGWVNY